MELAKPTRALPERRQRHLGDLPCNRLKTTPVNAPGRSMNDDMYLDCEALYFCLKVCQYKQPTCVTSPTSQMSDHLFSKTSKPRTPFLGLGQRMLSGGQESRERNGL